MPSDLLVQRIAEERIGTRKDGRNLLVPLGDLQELVSVIRTLTELRKHLASCTVALVTFIPPLTYAAVD